MSQPDNSFSDLVRRVREGESAAAAELVRLYEPEIRRVVRVRMTDPRLRRVVDSMDVCQSVLANFFLRASAGQFDLNQPDELIALLVAMVRNKVVDQARRMQAGKRDSRRVEAGGDSVFDRMAGDTQSPDRIVADREIVAEARRRLSPDERYLAEQRALGREWNELAEELKTSAEALRKKLTRALDRVAAELGAEEAE